MSRLAILGSYPEGTETDNYAEYPNMWSPWKRKDSSPYKVWNDALPALHRTIAENGSFNIYVHFGRGANVPLVLAVKDVDARPEMFRPQTPIFSSIGVDETAHVWIQYKSARELRTPIDPRHLTERCKGTGLFDTSRPVNEASWNHTFRTGLFFIEDPRSR